MNNTQGTAPAFGFVDNRSSSYEDNEVHYGLTKREYFAAMALNGLLYQNLPVDRALNEKNNSQVNSVAEAAVKMADTLIEQLNKQ